MRRTDFDGLQMIETNNFIEICTNTASIGIPCNTVLVLNTHTQQTLSAPGGWRWHHSWWRPGRCLVTPASWWDHQRTCFCLVVLRWVTPSSTWFKEPFPTWKNARATLRITFFDPSVSHHPAFAPEGQVQAHRSRWAPHGPEELILTQFPAAHAPSKGTDPALSLPPPLHCRLWWSHRKSWHLQKFPD